MQRFFAIFLAVFAIFSGAFSGILAEIFPETARFSGAIVRAQNLSELIAPPDDTVKTVTQRPLRPKLVVNMVVGGLSWETFQRFRQGLSDEGFVRFMADGTIYKSARYNYMQTISPTGLATLTTGVNPSMHGIVSGGWIDYVTGAKVSVVQDFNTESVGGDAGTGRFSPQHIVMPTVGDRLLAESPESKVISVAVDPPSAIIAGGRSGVAYWLDPQLAVWVTSTAYMPRLPAWVAALNNARPAANYVESGWTPARPIRQYINKLNTIFGGQGGGRRITTFERRGGGTNGNGVDYGAMLRSPIGNTLLAEFARQVVEYEGLGVDDATDMLNICFDASRSVASAYGGGSMEVEDMIYRLDIELGALVKAISTRVGGENVLFVLTSDHGSSGDNIVRNSQNVSVIAQPERFNVAQFRTILNSFLGVQFGSGEWVLDYIDRQVYLNRNLLYQKNLNLEDVQNRAAAFVLQFRGVSHVLTSTALAGGYFGEGYGKMMQNSFYPRRGGDLMINLLPGWIEERAGAWSLSGSMYDYDRHVPLLMFGWKISPGQQVDNEVDMISLAPTLAAIMGIGRPIGSEGGLLPGFSR